MSPIVAAAGDEPRLDRDVTPELSERGSAGKHHAARGLASIMSRAVSQKVANRALDRKSSFVPGTSEAGSPAGRL